MRGDKVRTYRLQEDMVVDHTTGIKCSWSQLSRGNFSSIYNK